MTEMPHKVQMQNAFFLIQQCIAILSKTRTQNIFDLHLTSSQSLLRLLSRQANKICTWADKQACMYFWWNTLYICSNPIYSSYIVSHEMSSGMSAYVSYKLPNCKKVRQAGGLKSMSSKTILLGLAIFQCSSERSEHVDRYISHSKLNS